MTLQARPPARKTSNTVGEKKWVTKTRYRTSAYERRTVKILNIRAADSPSRTGSEPTPFFLSASILSICLPQLKLPNPNPNAIPAITRVGRLDGISPAIMVYMPGIKTMPQLMKIKISPRPKYLRGHAYVGRITTPKIKSAMTMGEKLV